MRKFALLCGALLSIAAKPAPVTSPDYQPQDKDERGIWMQMEEEERRLQTSSFIMHDPALNDYVQTVFCKTVGEGCKSIRIYIVRTPYFNASMAPNGMMIVYSGLFLRARNEAQLAAVLGHEYTHYRNKHSLQIFRDLKKKSNVAGILSVIPVASYAAFAAISLVSFGIEGSVWEFGRDMERDADAGSIGLLVSGSYDPHAASQIWDQLRAEMDATAVARDKKSRKDKDRGMFQTHPPTAERMATLRSLADKQVVTGTQVVNREAYRSALAPYWSMFIDDQIKLNDFGATEFLLANLAKEGWTPELSYARGELYRSRGKPEDLKAAAGFYRAAINGKDPPSESWRGLGLALLRGGDTAGGQDALKTYLGKRPDATDRAMMAMLAGVQQ
jgi:beta-barrel assembly-enhancing protease